MFHKSKGSSTQEGHHKDFVKYKFDSNVLMWVFNLVIT